MPLTDWKDRYQQAAWMIKIKPNAKNGLSKISSADSFQIRSISIARFVRKLGEIELDEVRQIGEAIALVIEFPFLN